MKKYIIRYEDYDDVFSLLGHDVPHSNLQHLKMITVELTKEEYEALIGASIKIKEDVKVDIRPCYTPSNIPFRGFGVGLTPPDTGVPINDYLNLKNAHTAGFTGAGVKVAILDTGCNDIGTTVVPTLIREDYTGEGVQDDINHGGRLCNILGQVFTAFAPYTTPVTYGICHGAQIIMKKVIGGDFITAILEALNDCIEEDIDVINMSFQVRSGNLQTDIIDAVTACMNAGIICVAASGNTPNEEIMSPGNTIGVICVNSVNYDNASVTNGTWQTFGYPDYIPNGTTQVTVTNYNAGHAESYVGGTSQAAAMVTGLLAIYKQKYPSLDHYKAFRLLQKRALQMDGYTYNKPASPIGGVAQNYETGAGFLASLN